MRTSTAGYRAPALGNSLTASPDHGFSPEVFSACLPTGGAVPSVLLLTFALLGVFCSYLEKSLLVPSKHLQHSCFLGRQET